MTKNKNQLKSTKKPLSLKQLAMVEPMKAQLGNVTAAISEVGIERTTHYLWMKRDEAYREAIENIDDLVLDFAESALHKQILNNNTPATLFLLKTKGKKRGYIERQEVALSGGVADFVQSFNEVYEQSVGEE